MEKVAPEVQMGIVPPWKVAAEEKANAHSGRGMDEEVSSGMARRHVPERVMAHHRVRVRTMAHLRNALKERTARPETIARRLVMTKSQRRKLIHASPRQDLAFGLSPDCREGEASAVNTME